MFVAAWNLPDWIKGMPDPTPEDQKWYRVRKTWKSVKSQLGAYKSLDNAIAQCPKGYNVYDWNGKKVYSNK